MWPVTASGWLVLAALAQFAVGCRSVPPAAVLEPETELEPDPEGLCASWAVATCADLATCCQGGASFDGFECYRRLSAGCLESLDAEGVHSGARLFDEDAAAACLAPVVGCRFQTVATPDQDEACHNAVTGRRPAGAGCASSSECLRPREGHAICYQGIRGGEKDGVCATVVVSDCGECGFVKSTAVLTVCPANSRCDVRPPQAAGAVPSDILFAFEGDCRPLPSEGQECASLVAQAGTPRACAEGLSCAPDPADAERSVCLPRRLAGETCTGERADECVDGATCDDLSGACLEQLGAFCAAPLLCGDGACESGEDGASCPEDCASCGNGLCERHEKDWCPADCGEPACVGCARFVTLGGTLCEGASTELYDAFFGCACGGPCAELCGGDFCAGEDIGTGCLECSAAAAGCAAELSACAYDL